MRWLALPLLGACWTAHPIAPAPIANSVTPTRAALPRSDERWTGTGHQYDDDSYWEMALTIDPQARIGGEMGTIEYPSLGCSGVIIRDDDDGDDLIAREQITINPEHRCIDGGKMVIPRIRGASFHWTWRFPQSGQEDADATLTRAR